MNSWQVGVAAKAFAAGQFARYGFDVSVLQYDANQPEYDLIVGNGDKFLKVSVKGSQDGSWGLTQSYIKNADYHGAADEWLQRYAPKTVLCLVQFKDVRLDKLPRMYLATPHEIAQRLKDSAKGRGETILYEYHEWGPRAYAYGTIDRIPESWKFSKARIEEMFTLC